MAYVELLWAVEDDNTLFACCLVWGDNGLHQMAAGIALVEVAIGKTQTDKRTAKAAVIDFFHPGTGREWQTRHMRAQELALDPDRAGREFSKPSFALAVYSDGADHRAVGKDAAHPGRAFEASKGEQLANNERARLLRAKLLGPDNPPRSQKAGRQDGRIDKRPAHRHRHHSAPNNG